MVEKYDVITLRGLSAVGNHGVYDFERSGSQVFSADLTLYVDSRLAAQTDDVRNTVDYSALAEEAVGILTGTPVYLLETLADRLAQMALGYPHVFSVEVTVHKPMAPVRHQFQDVSVTVRREHGEALLDPGEQVTEGPRSASDHDSGEADGETTSEVHRVVLALGANLGRPVAGLTNAIGALMEVTGLEIDQVSSLYRTKPVLHPGQAPQPDYYNAVVVARTVLTPLDLLAATQSIEDQFGRDRQEHWGARPLDIDIIDYDSQVIHLPGLDLPHPRAQERAFVLRPWAEVAPTDRLPDGASVAHLAVAAPDASGIVEVRPDWLLDDATDEDPQDANTAPAEVAGKPEVLVVPPPPPAPAETPGEHPAPVPAPMAAVDPKPVVRPAPPRRVRPAVANETSDYIFQSLARKEERHPEVDTPKAKSFPSRRSLKPASAQAEVPPYVPADPSTMNLPDWQFPTESSVRIVDSDVPIMVDEEPTPSQPSPRRRTVRPTPTGTIPVIPAKGQIE